MATTPRKPKTAAAKSAAPDVAENAAIVALGGASVAAKAAPQDEGNEFVLVGLRVRSVSPNGFRRCGIVWGPEFTEVAVSDLPAGSVEILLTDPDLVVEVVTDR